MAAAQRLPGDLPGRGFSFAGGLIMMPRQIFSHWMTAR